MSPGMKNALALVCSGIEKKYGQGAVMKLTDKPDIDKSMVIPSGSIALDTALGIGGYRRGRIIEVYGPESSGKTTLALHAIAEAQKLDEGTTFIDAEHSLDPDYAEMIGVDIDKMLIAQPDYGEQALDITDMLVRSGAMGLIVIDSVAALVPKKELEGEIGDYHVGAQARMMSQAMRKLTGVCSQTGCSIMFINQIRMKIGVMFGSPETTSGGNALKFYASQRLDIRRIGDLKDRENLVGNKTKVKVVKNKTAPPKKIAEFDIVWGEGIDSTGEVLDLGVSDNIVNKSGAWYDYKGTRIGQGRSNAIEFLNEHKDIREEISTALLEYRGLDDQEVEKEKPEEKEE